jgi:hypothetical protein
VLVRRFFAHTSRGGEPRNIEPWQALAEKRSAALNIACIGMRGSDELIRFSPNSIPETDEAFAGVALAYRLWKLAVPYLWSAIVEDLVRKLPLPRHVVSRDVMAHPWMFFSYEVAYGPSAHPTEPGLSGMVDWMLLEHGGNRMHVIVPMNFGSASGYPIEILPMSIPYGATWPDDFDAVTVEPAGMVLKRLAFVNSPYTETQSHRLPRPIRREMQRFGQDAPELDVDLCRVVVLRRAAAEAQERHDRDDEPGREYRGHWWVSGHFRAQWYPSLDAHRVIWIAPYVKGDLDKPLLEKTYAVGR